MQSLSRQLRRGNAVFIYHMYSNSIEIVTKRGTSRGAWRKSYLNRSSDTADKYVNAVTRSLTKDEINKASLRGKRQIFKNK